MTSTETSTAIRYMLDCGHYSGTVTSQCETMPGRVFVRCTECGQTEIQPDVQGVTYALSGASHIFRWVDEARIGEIVQRGDADWDKAYEIVESARVHAQATGSVGATYTDDRTRVGGHLIRGVVGDGTLPGRDRGGNWVGFVDADVEKRELAMEDVSALRERLTRYRRRTIVLADATAAAIRDDRLFDAQRELDAAKETATATLRVLEVLRRVEDGEL